jgi:hypothetical protein
MHTGLQAIDITRIDDYAAESPSSGEDQFADLVVEALVGLRLDMVKWFNHSLV